MFLPVRPKVCVGESLRGYVERLAAANGVTATFGFRSTCLNCLSLPENTDSFIKEKLNPRYRITTHFRYCPLCWNEQAYFREEWDLALMPVCAKHQIPLKQFPSPLPENIWDTNHRLIDPDLLDHGNIPAARRQLILVVTSLINTRRTPHHVFWRLLGDCSLSSAFKLILLFGSYVSKNAYSKPQKACFKNNIRHALNIFDSAAIAFSEWPNCLKTLLPKPDAKQMKNRRVDSQYGYFYMAVNKELGATCFKQLRQEIQNHILSTWPDTIDSKTKWITEEVEQRQLPGTIMAELCGVSLSTIKALVEKGIVQGTIRKLPSGKEQTALPRSEAETIISLRSSTLCDVSKSIGVPKKVIKALIDHGHIEGLRTGPHSPWIIIPESLETFKRTLISKCNIRKDLSRLINVATAARYYCDQTHHQDDIYEAVLTGNLSAYLRIESVNSLSAEVFLDKRELLDWQRSKELTSIPRLAQILEIKQEVAYGLVRRGFIKTVDQGRNGRFVSEKEIEEFREQYIFLRDLAKLYRTSSTSMLNQLSKIQVFPVSGPTVDGSRQYLLLRNSIRAI